MGEGLGEAVKAAVESLPEGYRIQLEIKKNECTAMIVLPDDIFISIDRNMTLGEEIEALVELAIRHSGERKPLTEEQLFFQRWAD